ncbi:hypothetical protein [Phaeodactylibacter sp.]|uniref:hypothetical protein n=1 Tax=Phaeodactylibacter sp. TaxID=1940289 RepID=UPI0025E00678|nr:hypothetical protein [Phaeodactylibacter sp.]MCI4650844.1 hypothetical protein [Phaeodactylibacter sp.]MCI5089801.1 hypothetical protein [Phaeodactylibacter sp.]
MEPSTKEKTKKNSPETEAAKAGSNMPPPEDFFAMKTEIDDDMRDFLSHMKREKEVIDVPEIEIPDEPYVDPDIDISDEDKGHLRDLNYTQEHKFWAELMLIQLDKSMAWIGGIIAKEDPSKYRMRKKKSEEDDYEVALTAALINKYQVKFSLEFALAFLLLGKYGMMATKVQADVRAKKKAEAEEAKKQQDAARRPNHNSDR